MLRLCLVSSRWEEEHQGLVIWSLWSPVSSVLIWFRQQVWEIWVLKEHMEEYTIKLHLDRARARIIYNKCRIFCQTSVLHRIWVTLGSSWVCTGLRRPVQEQSLQKNCLEFMVHPNNTVQEKLPVRNPQTQPSSTIFKPCRAHISTKKETSVVTTETS